MVRCAEVWAIGFLALALPLACGGTSKKPKPMAPASECGPDDCTDECKQGCEPECEGDACLVDCEPGEKQCVDGDVYTCASTGTSLELTAACTDPQVCDSVAFECRFKLCEEGALSCLGSVISECSESGTAFVPTKTDCADDEATCVQGDCVSQSCSPGASTCKENAVFVCASDGLSEVLSQDCTALQHCVEMAGAAYCANNQCTPGELVCDLNTLKECTEEGTIPATGTDCGNYVCQDAQCKPRLCTASSLLCVEGNVHICNSSSTGTDLMEQCAVGTRCEELADRVGCSARPCEPKTSACLGNARGTCADDGESLAVVAQDCAVTEQVCDASVACSASALDVSGKAEQVEGGSGSMFGNIIDVHSDRLVTKLEANLLLEAPRDLRFVIYELKDSLFELDVSEITANNNGSGFAASGPLSYELKAGKRYYMGVGLVVGEGYAYYDAVPWSPKLSFGNVVGSFATSFTEQMNVNVIGSQIYQLRVTTALP